MSLTGSDEVEAFCDTELQEARTVNIAALIVRSKLRLSIRFNKLIESSMKHPYHSITRVN